MNKPFDFSTLKEDRSFKYVHDRARENPQIACSERFYVCSERNPASGVLFKTRSMRQASAAKNYLSSVWGKVYNPQNEKGNDHVPA